MTNLHIEAEEAVIGSMLTYGPAVDAVCNNSPLTAEDFDHKRHQILFSTIVDLHERGDGIDSLTVASAIEKNGQLDAIGGPNVIPTLAEKVAAPGNALYHANIVFEATNDRDSKAIAGDLQSGKITAEEAATRLAAIQVRKGALKVEGLTATSFDQIERERVEWLWENRIPLGMMTLLIGDPGLGKSTFSTFLAGPVSRAGAGVLLLTGEDDPAATIRPRLEAVEADLTRVHTAVVRRDGMDEGVTLPDDGPDLQALVRDRGIRLVVVDPLAAFLPATVNSWNNQSMRRALGPLYAIARDERCAVLIVDHLNKGKQSNALYRAGGSIGVPAAVRSALLLARDPGDPEGDRGNRRILAHIKCNVGPQRESLTCEIETVQLDDESMVPRLAMTGVSEATAAELLTMPDSTEAPEREEAEEFLLTELADGPKSAREMQLARNDAGISDRTLKRAKKALGIVSEKLPDGSWQWSLGQEDQGGPLGQGGHEKQGGQPYISTVAPFTNRAKNTHTQSGKNGQGGQGSEIAGELLKEHFDAVEVPAKVGGAR